VGRFNVTRKNKIRSALALLVAGALVWGFGPGEKEALMRITYAGVSTNDPNQVLFSLTNTSRKTIVYAIHNGNLTNRYREDNFGRHIRGWRRISPANTDTFSMPVLSSDEWWILGRCDELSSDSFWSLTRERLQIYAYLHDWVRVEHWLRSKDTVTVTYGPLMLSNRPAPPARP
jgi:hypothetical protein